MDAGRVSSPCAGEIDFGLKIVACSCKRGEFSKVAKRGEQTAPRHISLTEAQQEAVIRLYYLLEQTGKKPDKSEVHRVWRNLEDSTHRPRQRLILDELH